jgi:hypothetical protein
VHRTCADASRRSRCACTLDAASRAGDITPASAVDLVSKDSSVVIIDIRSAREKAAIGVPEAPGSARGRFLELEIAEIERRLRGQLKNVDAVEAQACRPTASHIRLAPECSSPAATGMLSP